MYNMACPVDCIFMAHTGSGGFMKVHKNTGRMIGRGGGQGGVMTAWKSKIEKRIYTRKQLKEGAIVI